MKKYDLGGNIFLALFFCTFFLGEMVTIPKNTGLPMSHPEEAGVESGPTARLQFEWLRLKSPYTNEIPDGIRLRSLKFAESLPKENGLPVRLERSSSARLKALNWTLRGPYNIGGRTRGVVIDKKDP
ncbi:MAG: hypothetical protein U9N31_04405, partial [Candidatus Marinimicrobia bacterium]|nr:hypothetical protein [Candidatus Neomarinimicrobiota bacterium]